MTLRPKSKIGSYEIVSPLGAGGMGEVYLARDGRLDRQVAIKVLPEPMTRDPERVARFEREAKLLASLNHPNIAAIHGFDDSDGKRFLVMEYVEGETLGRRLKSGAFAVEDALDVAKQMAEALEAAHEKGVIHRDLKPGNVMIRPDGAVKVLDFGLAKAMAEEPSDSTSADSPTITANYTRPGVVLGTASYMSPEQARGRPLDKRTDIWSFGVILYECLTGQMLFRGETATDSMGAIMHREPDWSLIPPSVPPTVQLLLRRCLTKDRKRRLQDIGDARIELESAIEDPSSTSLGLARAALEVKTRRLPTLAQMAVFVIVLLATAVGVWFARPTPEVHRPTRRFEFAQDLKPRVTVISPDGTMVAFESENDVYVRDLDTLETRVLWKDGTDEQIRWLFWSPDSQWLGIQSDTRFWRIAVSGGRAVLVAERRAKILTTWSDEGYFETCDVREGSFIRIPARGGEPRTVLQKNEDEVHFHPGSSLPGGKGYLFVPHPKDDDARTICVATADGQRHDLYESDQSLFHPMYSHTGHIVFWQAAEPSGIWALPFSLERLQVTGEPFLVVSKVWLCSVSNTGDLVYAKRSGSAAMGRRLAWVDRSGKVLGTFGPTLYGATQPSLSPDGLRVAVSARGLDENVFDSDPDIWLVDVQRGTATRLAMEEGRQLGMTWSPDGKRIAYTTIAPGIVHSAVRVRAVDGSGQSEVLIADAYGYSLVDDWSMAALVEGTLTDDVWISIQRFEGESTRDVFQNSAEWDISPRVRPGGGLLAYSSGPVMSLTTPVFLRRFPEGEGRWRVSMTEARNTCWSRSGDRLFFVAIEGTKHTLMEVSVTMDESGVRLGEVTPLFSMSDHEFGDFDVAPDGERFLMLQSAPKPGEEETEEGIVLIENWFEEFRTKTK